MTKGTTILVVDDRASARDFMARYLEGIGYRVLLASSVPEAEEQVATQAVHLVIMDLKMPKIDGIEGLRRLKAHDSMLPVIVLTAYATVETAVTAMKLGARDYLRKPFETEEMEILIARALEHRRLVEENIKLRAAISDRYRLENLIGKSRAMERIFELIRKAAAAELPVLITGESGTGKDLVARAIHGLSRRAERTFLTINCAAVPDSLLESELFGHTRGAFSGAESERAGYFREADGGTLFLDEIGEMSTNQQAKLLQVLESGEFLPVGSDQAQRVDVRIVTATNQDLEGLIEEQRFRQDLLYRIDTVHVHMPPLRERREDIPLLAAHFLERVELRTGRPAPDMGGQAMRLMLSYDWPGNVRELEHSIDHAVMVAESGEISAADLPPRLRGGQDGSAAPAFTGSYRDEKRRFEQHYFDQVLERAEGNISSAAQLAGLHRATVHEKLKQLGLGRVSDED
jgi:two-component system response regulator HydG